MAGPVPDPPDGALVVRGGTISSPSDLRDQAEANLRDDGERALSVFASDRLDLEGIVREARTHGRYLPHGTMSTCTASDIREIGADLEYTPPPPGHYSLMVPDDATDELYEALMAIFETKKTPQGRMPNVPPAS
jgi:hypothetical protein